MWGVQSSDTCRKIKFSLNQTLQSPVEATDWGSLPMGPCKNKSCRVGLCYKTLLWGNVLGPLHSCFDLFDDLYHGFGRGEKRTVILIPETSRTQVFIRAQLILLLILASLFTGLQVVQT